jgi:Tol biopolymer transport system component
MKTASFRLFVSGSVALWACCASAPAAPLELITAADPHLALSKGGSGDSSAAVVSPDGRWIAFASSAPDLTQHPKLVSVLDLFLWNRETRTLELLSLSTNGSSGGSGHSLPLGFSADNRLLIFESLARDLVTNAVTGQGDIYVRNLETKTTTLVSVERTGLAGGNGASTAGSFSPDGRFVTFDSLAADLVANDTNLLSDVFQRDLQESATKLVSMNWRGTAPATGTISKGLSGSSGGTASEDGRYVAFQSDAADLFRITGSSAPTLPNVYVRDMLLGTNLVVTWRTNRTLATMGESRNACLSADGRYVAFESSAAGLVTDANVTVNVTRVYWSDTRTTNILLLHPINSVERSLPSTGPVMSRDGQRVLYEARGQIYGWEASTASNFLVSANLQGLPANGLSTSPLLSADGQIVVFTSAASDLVEMTNNGNTQVYRRDLRTGTTTLVSANYENYAGVSTDCDLSSMDDTASVIALTAPDTDLLVSDDNSHLDVFCHLEPADPLAAAGVWLVSERHSATQPVSANGYCSIRPGALSADGRRIVYASMASDLHPLDPNPTLDIYVRDRDQATNLLASLNPEGTSPGSAGSSFSVLDPSGRRVLFASSATNLVANDTNRLEDLFLRDLDTGGTTLVSERPAGYSDRKSVTDYPPHFSPDGRYLAWQMSTTSSAHDIFLRDLSDGTVTCVTTNLLAVYRRGLALVDFVGASSVLMRVTTPNTNMLYIPNVGLRYLPFTSFATPAVTPDGRFVAWQSVDKGGFTLGRFDLTANTNLVVTGQTNPPEALAKSSWQLSISADGRFIAFVQPVSDTSGATPASVDQVMIADATQPGRVDLASFNPQTGLPGKGASGNPALSPNGRYLTFRSDAPDLVPNDQNGLPDIFVRDLQAGVTWLASARPDGSAGNERALGAPQISADASTVVFLSAASDLIAGDYNNQADIFAFAVPVVPSPDTDQDGLPDAWEIAQFTDLSHDGSADSDQDGLSDRAEYVAGTLPLNPASQFVVEAAPASANGKVKLAWKAAPERKYRIQFTDDLTLGTWQDLAVPPVADGDNLTVEDPSEAPLGSRFYRVLVYP